MEEDTSKDVPGQTDLGAAAVPNAKFSVPVEGAVLPLKEVPATAAITANQAMAA